MVVSKSLNGRNATGVPILIAAFGLSGAPSVELFFCDYTEWYAHLSHLASQAHITLAVFTFVVVLWIGEVVPVGVSGLLFCVALAVILGKRMPTSVIFSGFTNSTIWLIIGAFLLGEATVATGLAQHIAYMTMRLGKSSYSMVLVYLWVAQVILGLLTPSDAVRVVMFIPIMVGIVNTYKAKADSNLVGYDPRHNPLVYRFGYQCPGNGCPQVHNGILPLLFCLHDMEHHSLHRIRHRHFHPH
jgi:di/tricarboxylate transporter